jgi:hypothetical protein
MMFGRSGLLESSGIAVSAMTFFGVQKRCFEGDIQ